MKIDITVILEAVIALAAAVVTGIIVPSRYSPEAAGAEKRKPM